MIGADDEDEEEDDSELLSEATETLSNATDSGLNDLKDAAFGGSNDDTRDDSEESLFEADGMDGRVELHESKIVIRRDGLEAMLGNGGDKEIPISNVTSIQFKNPGRIGAGHIQFGETGYSGHHDGRGENVVKFRKSQKGDFETLKAKIDDHRQNGGSNDSSQDEDPAIQALREKFATGEISKAEYEERMEVLQDT